MADLFGRNVGTLGGVFVADQARLTLKGNLGVLVQSLQVSYAQSITRLYEVGGGNQYYIGGRTSGQLAINRVIGPSNSVAGMYAQYGDVCKARGNVINLTLKQTDCSVGGSATPANITMRNCVITQVSLGTESQAMIISENTVMMFTSLEADFGGAGANNGIINPAAAGLGGTTRGALSGALANALAG